MIECPEFDYNYENSHTVYLWCLHFSTGINILINPLIIYCIICHSSSHMATYRWFLVLHQIVALVADNWINLLAQPVFLVPLPVVYPLGYAKHFLSTKYIWNIGFILVIFEQTTVIILFSYRFWAAQGSKRVSLWWKCFALLVFLFLTVNIYLPLSMEMKTEDTFDKLAKNYTCVTPELRKINSIVALDKTEAILKCMWLIVFDACGFIIVVAYFTIGSWKATRTRSMSPKLRQMQQKFLLQLCLQSFVPLLVVISPIVMLVFVLLLDSFNFPWLNDIVWCCGSCFSIIGAIVLFYMNPTYHLWIRRHFTTKKTKLHRISSVKSVTQRF